MKKSSTNQDETLSFQGKFVLAVANPTQTRSEGYLLFGCLIILFIISFDGRLCCSYKENV